MLENSLINKEIAINNYLSWDVSSIKEFSKDLNLIIAYPSMYMVNLYIIKMRVFIFKEQ